MDARLRGAFADPDPDAGLRKAKALAAELERTHPDAAGSLREGLDQMFTVRRLGIDGTLAQTRILQSGGWVIGGLTRQVLRRLGR